MIIKHTLDGAELSDVSHELEIQPGTRNIIVGLTAMYRGIWRKRGALMTFEFTDGRGGKAIPDTPFLSSPAVGHFYYLNLEETEEETLQSTVEVLSVPAGATTLRLSGRNWLTGMRAEAHDLLISPLGAEGMSPQLEQDLPEWVTLEIPAIYRLPWNRRQRDRGPVEPGNSVEQSKWSISKEIQGSPRGLEGNLKSYRPRGEKPANKYKVALICDEFTYNSYSPEFDHAVLEPDNWREVMESHQPDFLFCESAWSGADSRRRPWRGQIYASAKFKWENRAKLFEILAYCRERGIPTVFWNKEDPTHFHDRVNDFVSTAARFDYVLTTAEEAVDGYRKFMPSDRVGVLQFAVQPRDFNPLSGVVRDKKAIFAGAWYDIHPERCETMRQGLDWVLDRGMDLEIYDRNKASYQADSKFPEEYLPYVNPAVSHKATARLYRSSSIGLNFNTVVDSSTMFARRVFELAASGSLVVSNYSPGIERIYGNDVVFYDREDMRPEALADQEAHRRVNRALRTTLLGHTYRHRFATVLDHLGLRYSSSRPAPTMLVKVSTPAEARTAIATFHAVTRDYSRLLLVVSRSVPSSKTGSYVTNFSGPKIDVISAELLETERVPSTNFLTTPDVIWSPLEAPPRGDELAGLLMHGEYSRLPMRLSSSDRLGMTAGTAGPGTRLAAVDVIPALLEPNTIRPTLEVPR